MLTQPFAIPAAIFFLLAIPLVLGLIPRNRFYGMRMPKTLSDDRVWYPVNRVAGVAIMIASGIYGVVAMTFPYERAASDNFSIWALHLLTFLGPILAALSVTIWYAKRI